MRNSALDDVIPRLTTPLPPLPLHNLIRRVRAGLKAVDHKNAGVSEWVVKAFRVFRGDVGDGCVGPMHFNHVADLERV